VISKIKSIVTGHNMSAEYQQLATANTVKSDGTPQHRAAPNTFLDTNGRVTAFNRRSLIQ